MHSCYKCQHVEVYADDSLPWTSETTTDL